MSFKKFANASLSEPTITINEWEKMHGNKAFQGCHINTDHPFCKTASIKKISKEYSKFLLSHATIMSSVAVEKPPKDYLVRPSSSAFFNSNDDAWPSQILKMSYHTFRGSFSFVEHWQNSRYAKGVIVDSVLRKVVLEPSSDSNDYDPELDWIYYCDILVATDLAHEKLVEDIKNEKVKYLSMGCVTEAIFCSYCGKKVTDQDNFCSHLQYQKGTFLNDENGIPRRIGELCGDKSLPNGGVKFVEASFVLAPAFPGAAIRNIVSEEWVGPKTKYTAAAKEASKVASNNKAKLGELLFSKDPSGENIR